MLCFGISEQEIESALSSTKTAFCISITVADKPANLEQCVTALKVAVDTLARIRKDGLWTSQQVSTRLRVLECSLGHHTGWERYKAREQL
jgi:hypothetical protein